MNKELLHLIMPEGRNITEYVYAMGVGEVLERIFNDYFGLYEKKHKEFIFSDNSIIYRFGNYVLKISRYKFSKEVEICPSLYLFNRNIEEFILRSDSGEVLLAVELQEYLEKSVEGLDEMYFKLYNEALIELGYICFDTIRYFDWMRNCRILDNYWKADCGDEMILPEWFREVPVVNVDRDLVYRLK